MKRILAFVALVALCGIRGLVPDARADGFIVVDERYWIPGPVPPWPQPPRPPQPQPPIWPPRPVPPPRPYVFAPLEVVYHKVDVKIEGQVATTSVEQEFYNPNPSRLEGTYLFPVPKGAQIDKFAMDIGGKQVEAELLPAEKARKIYEDIVRKAKDPALMEYADRDVFKVRVFPIEPHGKKRITLSYTQVLKADAGLVGYVYPLNTEKFSAKPIKNVSIKVELKSDRPLKAIYSPSHSVEIKRHGSYRATAGFEATDTHPDTDFALYFAPDKDELGVNLITHRASGEDGYFLMLVSPGLEANEKRAMPKDVAFVLDTSGSMAGKKLAQAKKALQFCVENLNDQDRFEIIRFSTEVEPLFDNLVRADEANREKANDFIKDLKPIGGTAIDEALKKALGMRPGIAGQARPYVIIFLTDGKPTIGTTDETEIVRNVKRMNEEQTRVFCFGIGTDLNAHLLDKITEETRVVSQYVLPEEDIEVKVSSFFAKIKDPVLANPTLKFTGDLRVTKLYPSPLPDVFRGDQMVLVGRYSGRGDSAVVLEGLVNGSRRKFTYEVTFPKLNEDNEFVPRLWATRRVGYLLDEIRLHGENSELRDEVTDLARQYNIVTPYTAYLIVEDEERRNVPVTMQSLPRLRGDSAVRREAESNWDYFKKQKDGEKALAGARFGYELKNAPAATTAADAANVEALRGLGLSDATSRGGAVATPAQAAPAEATKAKLAEYSQAGRVVGNRNFFQNEKQWVDATAQKLPNAKRERIEFNSSEYFAFAAREKRALPYLSLGPDVQFVLDETVYEVYSR